VIAGMRARISNIKKIRGERVRKFGIPKLHDENTANIYAKRLEEHLKQFPCTGGETIQEWDLCKSTIQQVTEEVLGKQASRMRNEWFDGDCERATKEKNEAYLIMQPQSGTWNKVLRYQEKRREENTYEKKARMGKETVRRTSRHILYQGG
jgi:hypothetical protein